MMNNLPLPATNRTAPRHAAEETANHQHQPTVAAAQNIARPIVNQQARLQVNHDMLMNIIIPNSPFFRLLHSQTIDDLLACYPDIRLLLLTDTETQTTTISSSIKNYSRVVFANQHVLPELPLAKMNELIRFSIFLAEITQRHPRSQKIVNELTPLEAFGFVSCLPRPAIDGHLTANWLEIRRTLGMRSLVTDPSVCRILPDDLRLDWRFAQQLTIAYGESTFGFIDDSLRQTPYFQKLLRYATGESTLEQSEEPRDRSNAGIATSAVVHNREQLNFIDNSLKSSVAFVLGTVVHEPSVLVHETAGFREDYQFMLAAVDRNGHALQFANAALRDNTDVVQAAVENSGEALSYASNRLKNNEQLVFSAIKRSANALEHASARIKKSHEFMMASIKLKPMALQFADETLRGNFDVVAEAVKRNGMALQFTKETLRKDREIVISAVSNAGLEALEFAPEFKSDYLVVELAKLHQPWNQP